MKLPTIEDNKWRQSHVTKCGVTWYRVKNRLIEEPISFNVDGSNSCSCKKAGSQGNDPTLETSNYRRELLRPVIAIATSYVMDAKTLPWQCWRCSNEIESSNYNSKCVCSEKGYQNFFLKPEVFRWRIKEFSSSSSDLWRVVSVSQRGSMEYCLSVWINTVEYCLYNVKREKRQK